MRVLLIFFFISSVILLNILSPTKPISLPLDLFHKITHIHIRAHTHTSSQFMVLWNVPFLLPFRISHKSTFQGCQLNLLTLPLFSFPCGEIVFVCQGFSLRSMSLSVCIFSHHSSHHSNVQQDVMWKAYLLEDEMLCICTTCVCIWIDISVAVWSDKMLHTHITSWHTHTHAQNTHIHLGTEL